MPFPYPQNNQFSSIKNATIAQLTVGKRHCRVLIFDATIAQLTVGKRHCRVLIFDATIAQLTVGKRHCRVLNVGNMNSDATGFDISPISYIQPSAVPAWSAMYRHPPQLPQNKQEVRA